MLYFISGLFLGCLIGVTITTVIVMGGQYEETSYQTQDTEVGRYN